MTAVSVAGLLHEPPGATRDVRLRDHYVSLGPDVDLAGPLDADLHLQRTNRGILVRGQLRAPIRRVCARCLDPFVDDVTAPISEEFLPSIDPESGAPVHAERAEDEGQGVRRIDDHHEIQLDGVFHDELLLQEPMLPLDRPDCPGLCSVCGEKLDRGDHRHESDEIDPRLAALAALLERPDADRNGE
jgi:uncharacterized protein